MTDPAQRFLALLDGERVKRPPFWEVWFDMGGFCARRYGSYSRLESRIAMALDLGMAALPLGGIDTHVAFSKTSKTADGQSRYDKGTLSRREQLVERGDVPDWSDAIPQIQRERETLRDAGLACWMVLPWCFHSVATSMGLERFALACCDDPDFVRAALAWVEERNRKAIDRAVSRVRPDLVLFDGDCAFKTGLMVNPKMFRDLTWDITEETLSHLRPLGIPYAFHSDGAVGELLPMLIELGFAAFHGCEKQANDLGGLVERFGDDLCLVGNMDVVFLAHARPEEVRRETRKMLEVGSRKGRFAAACNTSPMDYIPDENYIAMTQTIQEFARA